MINMYNTKTDIFKTNRDEYGALIAIESGDSVSFPIQRIYYIFDVGQGVRRGFHAHQNLRQALICTNGSVKILVKTPHEEEIIVLDSPDKVLYIGSMVWREMFDFSPGAVLTVLASEHYTVEDYIRDFSAYSELFLKMEKEHSLPEDIK